MPVPSREFLQQVAALKHDLGKYVAWMSANLDDDAWPGPVTPLLVDSLVRDILATRTTAAGQPETAWAVWARLSAGMPPPWPDELQQVAAAVVVLQAAEPALRTRDLTAIAACRLELRTAQRTIRMQLQQLHRRLAQAVS